MKKFIIKSSLFVVVFFVVSFLLQEMIFWGINLISVGEFGVLNKIEHGEINAEILISGSSRTLKGINPVVIEEETGLSCYNISSDGVSLEIQVPKLKMYLNKNKPPKILVQNVSILGGWISNSIYEPYKYLPYLSDDDLLEGLEKIDSDFWIHKYIPVSNLIYFNFDFYVTLLSELKNSILGENNLIKGFYPDNSKWATSLEQLKIRRPNGITVSISNKYNIYLNELIKVCKFYNIKLVLVSLPYHHAIYKIENKKMDVKSYYERKCYGNNIYFADYSDSEIAKSTMYFYNFTHLNKKGADNFSKLLAAKLIELSE